MEQKEKGMSRELINDLKGSVAPESLQELVICCAFNRLYKNKELDYVATQFPLDPLSVVVEGILANYPTKIVKQINGYLEEKTKEDISLMIRDLILNANDYSGYRWDGSASEQVSDLALELLDLSDGGDVLLDVGSGIGSFMMRAMDYAKAKKIIYKDLLGVEIHPSFVNLSNMAFSIVGGGEYRPFAIPCNVIKDQIGIPYTKAFLFPPFGMKYLFDGNGEMRTRFDDIKFKSVNKSEWLFIDKLLGKESKHLHKAVAIVTAGALFNAADAEYRSRLAKEGLVEGIIELPQGTLYPWTGIKVCMLVLGKNVKRVKLIDATNLQTSSAGPLKKCNKFSLPIAEIVDLYNSEKVETISAEKLSQKSNWLPSSLAIKVKAPKNGVPLGGLAEVFTGSQYTSKNFEEIFSDKTTDYRILTSADIQDGTVNWKALQAIDYKDTKFDRFAVQQNDVIVTSKSSKVKTAVVDIDPKEKILVTGGMIVIRPKTEKLNPTYLKIFLDSEDGREALKSIQKGTVIVTINSKDLKDIVIPLADIEKQKEKARRYNEKMSTLLAYRKEIEKIENSLRNFGFEDEEGD